MAKRIETKKEEKVETLDIDTVKKELTTYINDQVRKGFSVELERAHKRLIREKNKKIVFRDLIIIILLALCGYLSYRLYTTGYLDKYLIKVKPVESNKKESKKETPKKEEPKDNKPSLDELKEEYGKYLNRICINENSKYLEDYYSGNITTELKNYIVVNSIDSNDIKNEDEYSMISEEAFKETYEKIFEDEYTNKSFEYNGIEVRFISSMKSYITDKVLKKEETNIQREIIDIDNKDNIKITTVEGLIKDKKLYNIVTNEEVKDYDNKKLSSYEDDLTKVTYTFNKDGKLLKIA